MTNALWWLPSIQAEGVVRDPTAPGRFPSIDPADVAAVAAVALTSGVPAGHAYVLTGGKLLSVREQVEILSEVLGQPIRYVDQGLDEAHRTIVARGTPSELAAAARELNEAFRADRTAFLTDVVERLTGRPPATFKDWCHRYATAFASNEERVSRPRGHDDSPRREGE
jgi:uncharacterized protein YbjT (DUF2867 family)